MLRCHLSAWEEIERKYFNIKRYIEMEREKMKDSQFQRHRERDREGQKWGEIERD